MPLHPARAVADMGRALPPGGLLAADPGIAGLWVARTFPTPALASGEPRRVVVPARREPGAATHIATKAAEAGRSAIAVTTAPLDDATAALLASADKRSLPLVVIVWSDRGRLRVVDEHAARLADAIAAPGASLLDVPVNFDETIRLVEAAGEVVAWGGLG